MARQDLRQNLDFVSKCSKFCIKILYRKRTWFIGLQLSRSLNFTQKKFFCLFGRIEKGVVYYLFSRWKSLILQNCNQLNKLKDAITKKTGKIGESMRRHFSLLQCKTTCCIDYKRKIVTIWLERSIAFSVLLKFCFPTITCFWY